jgi:3-oxoacyl-[acyl-carrier-protein] synthase-3
MLNVIDFTVVAPDRSQTIADLAESLGLSQREVRMYNRFFGYEQFRCDPEQSLDEMLQNAESALAARHTFERRDISIVAYCHTLMSSGPLRSTEASLIKTYGRAGAESLSFTMNHCATAVSALAILETLLPRDGLGLILVGDKAFHPTVRHIVNTTIMGEAAAAILVGRAPGRFSYLDGYTNHDGRFSLNSGRPDDEYLAGFDSFYIDFAVGSIVDALRRFSIGIDDIRWLLPHNANAASWRQIGQQLGVRKDQIFMTAASRYGHCFAADPFVNLFEAARDGMLKDKDKVLLVSIGLGATASCALLEVNSNH